MDTLRVIFKRSRMGAPSPLFQVIRMMRNLLSIAACYRKSGAPSRSQSMLAAPRSSV
jgi:hypothetical protein